MKQTRSALGRGLASLISSKPVSIVPPAANNHAGDYRTADNTIKNNPVNHSLTQDAGSFDGSAAYKAEHFTTPFAVATAINAQKTKETIQPESSSEGVRYLEISALHANPNQPRKEFSEPELKELTDSIKTLGVLQPILVRARPSTTETSSESGSAASTNTTEFSPAKASYVTSYEIVAGERRFRAAQRAGLTKVPVIIRHLSEREVVEIALVENIQRADLTPLEEARGYNRLSEEFGLTQREISERVGKDRATVANFMRLLSLPPQILEMMRKGELSMGHAKAILTVREPAVQINLARKVVLEGLSVRAIEAIVSRAVVLPNSTPKTRDGSRPPDTITPEVAAIIDRLRGRLGTKVSVSHHASGKGRIEVEYFSIAELERLIEVIGG